MTERACDACHIRRTKCSKGRPCSRCTTSGIECSYLLKPKRKGPAGKTVSRLRERGLAAGLEASARSIATPSDTADEVIHRIASPDPSNDDWLSRLLREPALVVPFPSGTPTTTSSLSNLNILGIGTGTSSHSKTAFLKLLEPMLVMSIERYHSKIFPLFPIVDIDSLRSRFARKEHWYDKQFAALILSCAAISELVPGQEADGNDRADELIDEAISLHNTADLGERPTLECIGTSMNIGAVLRARRGAAAAYMRSGETMHLVNLLNLQHQRTLSTLSASERDLAIRIVYAILCSERSNSIIYTKPTVFKVPRMSLEACHPETSVLLHRMQPTTQLFELMDESLLGCLNGDCEVGTCSYNALQALATQQALESVKSSPLQSSVQLADFFVTREWLHLKIWQVCLGHSLLQGDTPFPPLRLDYPIMKIAKVSDMLDDLPFVALKGNGPCMGRKLKDIADAAELLVSLEPELPSSSNIAPIIAKVRETATSLSKLAWMRWEVV